LRKFIAIFGIVLIFAMLAGCGANSTVASWSTSGTLVNNSRDESWELSVGRANGHIRRDATLSQDALYNLFVRSTNSDGQVILTLTQGDTEIPIDLTGHFDGFIVTTYFEPGSIRMRLDFESAADVDVLISWQAVSILS
jgi:hypothetical protein